MIGLELIDEEELPRDEDTSPVAYLLVPDLTALQHILSLWQQWVNTGQTPRNFTAWRDVFSCLRNLRVWGPNDRVDQQDINILSDEIEGLEEDELLPIEIELIYRSSPLISQTSEDAMVRAILNVNGRVLSRARLDEIAYHAILAQLPVSAIQSIINRNPESLAGYDSVLYIRPQSTVTAIEANDVLPAGDLELTEAVSDSPILALLDGVPIAGHSLLRDHIIIDDSFNLEHEALVTERVHGSAMASLIIHGDRNKPETPLARKLHCIPVLGKNDRFPTDRLIIDLIYQAIFRMRDGKEPTAPHVLIVNISLGNARRPFHGQISPWARLLDRLAYRYGILFIVSAGNITSEFTISTFNNRTEFEDASETMKADEVIRALGRVAGTRRLLSPSETVNGLTVGARNFDWVPPSDKLFARTNINPYPALDVVNPSSALGPGFANSVKPDLLMPAGREHLQVIASGGGVTVLPARASRGAGLKVAAPPVGGHENAEAFTSGTSAATALASRTAHRIHDALEMEYGQEFLALPNIQRAVLLKALLVHPARWPDATPDVVKRILGPHDPRQTSKQRDNIRRFLGYGSLDANDAVYCTSDRATFWCVGELENERFLEVEVPIPAAIGGQAKPHSFSATLAWFTPTLPGRKAYRSVRMRILDCEELNDLAVSPHSLQPNSHQTKRGTVFTREWSGNRAAVVSDNMTIKLRIQRDKDLGSPINETVSFGLAVTLKMPGELRLYEQVRTRLQPRVQLQARS